MFTAIIIAGNRPHPFVINMTSKELLVALVAAFALFQCPSGSLSLQQGSVAHWRQRAELSKMGTLYASSAPSAALVATNTLVGPHIPINEEFPGLKRVHANPDIYVIRNFLGDEACTDIIKRANSGKTMERSPVAYAGWTQDFKDLVELAAKGPVAWLALIGAWFQVKDSASANQVSLVLHALQNYSILFALACVGIAAFTKSRGDALKELRTSTSTTLDDLSEPLSGTTQFVRNAAELFGSGTVASNRKLRNEAALFEAPTVIRYEAGQVLAPHFDANRSAETEDANRGGQTLATLIVYLNDVDEGGLTRFGRLAPAQGYEEEGELSLIIRPKIGDALLFFPADADGRFDERTEHEGCPAVDEKWIARIWRHKSRVPPPFGLSESALSQL
jgi:2OG-Fe(II) oxygenase superfamily